MSLIESLKKKKAPFLHFNDKNTGYMWVKTVKTCTTNCCLVINSFSKPGSTVNIWNERQKWIKRPQTVKKQRSSDYKLISVLHWKTTMTNTSILHLEPSHFKCGNQSWSRQRKCQISVPQHEPTTQTEVIIRVVLGPCTLQQWKKYSDPFVKIPLSI